MTTSLFTKRPFVIGMVHLEPLPGSPNYGGDMATALQAARRDARALADGGIDAIMVENFFDVPFTRDRVEAETVAAVTVAVTEVRREADLPVGVNVLRNDGCSAMAIAVATGASFVRVNVLAAARLTDQGIVQGIAYDLSRLQARLQARHVTIMADLDVKHSAPLAPQDPCLEAEELVHRSGAGALILTGSTTGRAADPSRLAILRDAVSVPLVVGSGVTVDTVAELSKLADGFIVGTSLKVDGRLENPVDVQRVRALMAAVGEAGRQ